LIPHSPLLRKRMHYLQCPGVASLVSQPELDGATAEYSEHAVVSRDSILKIIVLADRKGGRDVDNVLAADEV